MTPEELFAKKDHLVLTAIKKRLGSYEAAIRIAVENNMEFDDLVQEGRIKLWELCLKYDPDRDVSFNTYVIKTLGWYISEVIHVKGTPFKLSRYTSVEEKNQINIRSIDLNRNGEETNEFFAVSPINIEEDVIDSITFNEKISGLDRKEKFVVIQKSYGYTDKEIGAKLNVHESTVSRIKNKAFNKINPNLKKSRLMISRKKNHLLQQVI
ncbi:sigma-70 family RNA polymerase sigma factor [Bacillus cereus group sp. BfR-BA-01033]|uniref:sigma-70 family RNA polymerase sigma factor n=2 Tax=Bacteria TaxID=2 RepID=UPI0029C33D1F|nr:MULTISPECIES: sigma-70 family RNA polymerase sigma factor [unclassified Bacillus cereus group]MDX5858475.1 sigma-70 family RNA polymerase sigma factor [Bacillus cereus group sp. BfR-BA-01363]MDX5923240.1 sigma-70 family RNA polymerase sigma factor [Bacillus cereus group sp. BfR-BA-01033]